ncbi:MAG TPA: class I SAM-dependent methyltransferase [Gaiellaceae bacterium]
MTVSTDGWPGLDRREPPRGLPSWSIRRPLADWLRDEAARAGERHERARVLDVGCGVKPYFPLFADAASEYVGVDVQENPLADVHGAVEALPLPDASFDIVLCTQVLEHADDPAQAVRELYRVTAPGGRVLASTHGVMVYHPNPVDLWRWTHAGLERLFEANGQWASVDVRAGAGTTACLGMLVATYVHLLAKRAHVARTVRPAVSLVNALSAAIDRRVAALREPIPGSLAANYHVVAERAA